MTDTPGGGAVTRVMVHKDETGGPSQQAAPVLLIAVNPALRTSGAHYAGRHDNLALNLACATLEFRRGAVAHIDDHTLQIRRRGMWQADAGDRPCDRADHLKLGLAPDPADILDRLQVDVFQTVRLHLGQKILGGLSFALCSAEPRSKLVA